MFFGQHTRGIFVSYFHQWTTSFENHEFQVVPILIFAKHLHPTSRLDNKRFDLRASMIAAGYSSVSDG